MSGERGPFLSRRFRILVVGIIGVALGAALAPAAVGVAVSLQKVLVTNSSAQAVYVQPPGHTVMQFQAHASMSPGVSDTSTVLYHVPSGHWLVVQEVSFLGQGNEPAVGATVWCDRNSGVALNTDTPLFWKSRYYTNSNQTGVWYFPPNSTVWAGVGRGSADTADYYSYAFDVEGYLTQKP